MKKNILISLFLTYLVLFFYVESIYANQQEEQLIQQNKQAAKSSTNQAMFVVHRIKCLNSNDRAALIACNKALSINPGAAALRNRRVALTNRLNPKPKRQAVRKVSKVPQRPVKKQVVQKRPNPPKKIVRKVAVPKKQNIRPAKKIVKTKAVAQVRKPVQNDNRKVIIQIQKSLNLLGFNVGKADGVAGKNTKKAIKDFQTLTNNKLRPNLDKKLQLALQKAQKQHVKANINYQLAKQQLSEGNLEESSLIINKYLKSAPWHKDLIALNIELKEQITIHDDIKKKKEISENLAKEKAAKQLALEDQLEKQKNLELKERQLKLEKIVSDSRKMLLNDNLENSMSLIEQGLTINPNQSDLLSLKSKVLQKQDEIQAQKEKDETLSILYARALNKFNKNELESANAFVDKGLSLNSQHLKLSELKSKISAKQTELITKKIKINNILNESIASLNTNDFSIALVQINQGLTLEPENLKLLELKAEILTRQKEIEAKKQTAEEIAKLYTKASDSFNSTNFENALAFVNEGLSLDSQNLKLLELKSEIAAKHTEFLAKKNKEEKVTNLFNESIVSFNNKEFTIAMVQINQGLTLEPENLKLLELKAEILTRQKEIEAKKQTAKEIAKLYNKASDSFNNTNFENALAFVNEGLSLDSQHLKLLELRSEIAAKHTEFLAKKNKEEKVTNLFNESIISFNKNEFTIAMVQINQGLSMDPDNLKLSELKAEVLTRQKQLDTQKQKNQEIARLYKKATESLTKNNFENALTFVNEGLNLDSDKQDFITLKKKIILKQQQLVVQKKTDEKIAMMLNLIEEKQNLLKTIDEKMTTEKQTFLNKAQQTLASSLSQ